MISDLLIEGASETMNQLTFEAFNIFENMSKKKIRVKKKKKTVSVTGIKSITVGGYTCKGQVCWEYREQNGSKA